MRVENIGGPGWIFYGRGTFPCASSWCVGSCFFGLTCELPPRGVKFSCLTITLWCAKTVSKPIPSHGSLPIRISGLVLQEIFRGRTYQWANAYCLILRACSVTRTIYA